MAPMAGHPRRRRSVLGLLAALTFSLAGVVGSPGAPTPVAQAASPRLPAWDGSVDLYRTGTFTTQRSWLWCTAAGVQIVRNIVEREQDHSRAAQRRYFDWMRRRNRYDLPVSAGVDPAGWTAGLRHFVDDRYRLVASRSFDAALRSSVTRLRATNLPVALTVANGGHGWILTGFSATADPLVDDDFRVTAVRVVGPLYGLQSRNGYDMKPGTSLTPKQLRRFFTPWRYAPKRMIWDGRYVSIQPVPRKGAPPAAVSPTASPAPNAAIAAHPSPTPPIPSVLAVPTDRPAASRPAVGVATPTGTIVAGPAVPVDAGAPPGGEAAPVSAVAIGLVFALAIGAAVALWIRQSARSVRTRE
jgi:hypothetical protein